MSDTPETAYTVSRLNREVRLSLNRSFGTVWVEGEISNLSMPASGHLYFSLKDEAAQVRCAMFRSAQRLGMPFRPADGELVLVRAEVSLYEPRGDYQLVVQEMQPAGDGMLRRRFEVLKQRLLEEGLFDPAHKKPIPTLPHCIGIITSPTGAAIHDILTVLKRRFPAIPVIVFPAQVQGEAAKTGIVRALQRADESGLCEVLILARGGGSLEDLWAFNEEIVARAIYACRTPVVTGIGHEVDFTIADFVADLRAPTPSAAAAAVTPDREEWIGRFAAWEQRLRRAGAERLARRRQELAWMERRLQLSHPVKRLELSAQRVDELERRLHRAQMHHLAALAQRSGALRARLIQHHPRYRLAAADAGLRHLQQRLAGAVERTLGRRREAVAGLGQTLEALSPLATLGRGYALVTDRQRRLIRTVGQVEVGEEVQVRLRDGSLSCRVEGISISD